MGRDGQIREVKKDGLFLTISMERGGGVHFMLVFRAAPVTPKLTGTEIGLASNSFFWRPAEA